MLGRHEYEELKTVFPLHFTGSFSLSLKILEFVFLKYLSYLLMWIIFFLQLESLIAGVFLVLILTLVRFAL